MADVTVQSTPSTTAPSTVQQTQVISVRLLVNASGKGVPAFNQGLYTDELPVQVPEKDAQGNPIPQIFVDVAGTEERRSGWISVPTPGFQVTDHEGRVTWSNAPDADVRLRVFGYTRVDSTSSESEAKVPMMATDGSGSGIQEPKDGMTVRPNGEEQVIVLERWKTQ